MPLGPETVSNKFGERLTPADAARYDAERKREAADNAVRRRASAIGVDDADWERVRTELEGRFGQPPSSGDVFWSLANQAAMDAASRGDWHHAKMVYFQQALHLRDEGRNFHHVRQESLRCGVREALSSAAQLGWSDPVLRVYGAPDDERDVCQAADGRRFSPNELLVDDPPIPHFYDDDRWCPCSVGLDMDSFREDPPAAAAPESPARRSGWLPRLFGSR